MNGLNEAEQFPTNDTKNLDDVDITDDFMFSYIMRQPDICIELLEYMFPEHKVKSVKYIRTDDSDEPEETAESIKADTQKTFAEIFGKRGVRLDVYLDDGKTVYNVEMQTLMQNFLPKRSRYYQAQIDINMLERGGNYDQLKPSYVIFICKFDPFKRGRYCYTFQNMCDEEKDLSLNDEAYKVFFSTTGTKGEISDRLRELLRYMNDTKDYPIEEAKYDLIQKINNAVVIAKKDDEWRRAYMTYQIYQRDAELRGEERGIALGKAEGKAEGEEKKAKEAAAEMYKDKISIDIISKYLKYPVSVIEEWLKTEILTS